MNVHTVTQLAVQYGINVQSPEIIEGAAGLQFLVDDQEGEGRQEGESPVYRWHDEATDILSVATHYLQGETFDYCVDPFCGGGHTGLPLVRAGFAKRLIGSDINPRAVKFAQVNATLNNLANVSEFYCRPVKKLAWHSGRMLYIANAPFALHPNTIELDRMRDGGEDGLRVFREFLDTFKQRAHAGDCAIGVCMSRIGDVIEVQGELVCRFGRHLLSPLSDRMIWRNWEGNKASPNPISMSSLGNKVDPNNQKDREVWREFGEKQKGAGWHSYGYFGFVIRL